MTTPRVLMAMSGGVDSSVAAARLLDEGLEVVGVTLHLWDYPDDGSVRGRCCAPEDQHDARRVADYLGIPHYTFDRRELFSSLVVDPFVEAYVHGKTPSPCVACNRFVKMAELFLLADRLGACLIATGHYARTEREGGSVRLYRGRDLAKDQSYFLFTLDKASLERVRFPLGASTKAEVRAEALSRGLPGATKGESQELCFVPHGRYDALVTARAGERIRGGPIVNPGGEVVGQHEGVHGFTLGQRKGLGVALGQPMFVVRVDAEHATVHLGPAEALMASTARIVGATWNDDVAFPLDASVRVRARHDGAMATLVREADPDTGEEAFIAHFREPVRAVSPGQMAVVYRGDRVLGGGTIASAGGVS